MMEIRNTRYNSDVSIDCEIEHPKHGWIPFTASPDDAPDIFQAALALGPAPYVAPPEPDPTELLAAERATLVCSPMQGMLALGETEWAKVQAYRDNQATFAEKVIIDRAGDWQRNSQNIAFFQHLLGMTDEQVDDLFRAAMEITA